MNQFHYRYLLLFISFSVYGAAATAQQKTNGQKADSILKLMTLDEKIGQMNQYNGDWAGNGSTIYLRDRVGSVVHPVKELKGFQQTDLQPGASATIHFNITADLLRFYNEQLEYVYEPGAFKVYIGGSSSDVKETAFSLTQ